MPRNASRTATVAATAARPAARRKAPARDTAHTAPAGLALPIVACIDGACESIGTHYVGTIDAACDVAETVIATLLGYDYGSTAVALAGIEPVAPGLYAATFVAPAVGTKYKMGDDAITHVVIFGTADDVPAPAVARKPAATPQVPAMPGMSPLGLNPARVSAEKPAKRLPAPAVAGKLKADAAAARAATTEVRVRVTFENAGSYEVYATAAQLAVPATFMKAHVCQRAAQYHEWPRVGIDYASPIGGDDYQGAVSFNGKRQAVTWGTVKTDARANFIALPPRAGMGAARPASAVDALGARMGIKPAGSHLAEAQAKAKAAGIKLGRHERMVAENADAAEARRAAGATPVEAPARMSAATREIMANAGKGILPPVPNFSAPTHERYRGKLAELVAMVKKADVAGLQAYHINPISTSPKAMNKYRNAAVIALTVKAEKRAARAAAA